MPDKRRYVQLKPAQLTVNLAFPQREFEPPLDELKLAMIEWGGLLRPIIVRPLKDKEYLVLDGRRQLKAIWELQDDGYEKLFRWLPCFSIPSDGPIMDLKLFLVLNQHAALGAGEYERALAAIEKAERRPPINQLT